MAAKQAKPAKDGAANGEASAAGDAPAPKRGKKKLLLALPVVVLVLGGGGAWFGGLLPFGKPAHADAPAVNPNAPPAPPKPPTFFDMPEIVANLNAPGRRASYIKLRSKLELSKPEDAAAITANMPRLQDLFTTYLREMRPEELRGSAGTHRLREELMARAALAAPPARVVDVLFVELLLQ